MPKTPPYLGAVIALFESGASRRPVPLSTTALGEQLGISQQAVSKQLLRLEAEGVVERRRAGRQTMVYLTPKGAAYVTSLYSRLKGVVEGRPRSLTLHGRLFTGLGEGAYYMSLDGYKKQFAALLGFTPFPGTLNISVDPSDLPLRKQLEILPGLEVRGFKDGKRTYGPVKCFKATTAGKYRSGALVIERTHHRDSVLEIISPVNIRRALRLAEGDRLSVDVQLP
jgi:riboflavin kinase